MLSELTGDSLQDVRNSVHSLFQRAGVPAASLSDHFETILSKQGFSPQSETGYEFGIEGHDLKDMAGARKGVNKAAMQNTLLREQNEQTPETQQEKQRKTRNTVNLTIATTNSPTLSFSIEDTTINDQGYLVGPDGAYLTREEVNALEENSQMCIGGAVHEEIIEAQNQIAELHDIKTRLESGTPPSNLDIPESISARLQEQGIASPTHADYLHAINLEIEQIQWNNQLDAGTNEFVPLTEMSAEDLLPPPSALSPTPEATPNAPKPVISAPKIPAPTLTHS